MRPRQIAIYKGRVKAVAMADKPAIRQSAGHFGQHAFGKIDMRWAVFDAQTHIGRQSDEMPT